MTKQNPFSVYDFLGYLIPGSLVVYSYLIIYYLYKNSAFDIFEFIEKFSDIKLEGIFFFIIISYTIGHLFSFLSSITVEKYANAKYNYPSKFLLGIKYDGFWNSSINKKNMLQRVMIIFFILPSVFFDWLFGSCLGLNIFYTKPLDSFLQEIVKDKTNHLFSKILSNNEKLRDKYKKEKVIEHDFHRLISHYAYEYSKNHQAKMSNYVALYGFLRTICLIFNLLALYFIYRVLFLFEFNLFNIYVILSLSFIAYLSFMAFMKFYRSL